MSLINPLLGRNTPESSKYGKSIKFEDGDIVIDPETKNPVFVTGNDNLSQTLERTVLTSKFSNILHPEIGIDYGYFFNVVRHYERDTALEVLEILIRQAITESTPFTSSVQEIKIKDSQTTERAAEIELLVSLSGGTKTLNIILNNGISL